ncbi:MAG: hypothetical protein V7636_1377 [Actinomycetota bacterium]
MLHGGGNTSVKLPWTDITGDHVTALYVKGSGWDLASIETAGFSPLDLARLRRLLQVDHLSDVAMMREMSAAKLDPFAPQPSVESLLHALLPHAVVMHSHADVIVTLTNVDDPGLVRDALGEDVLDVPYVMPGFQLAKDVARRCSTLDREVSAIVLRHHGLFTWGRTAKDAYARHIELVEVAERWLDEHAPLPEGEVALPPCAPTALAELRHRLATATGAPVVMCRHGDVGRFVSRSDLSSLASRGPLTPDHVIRTKRVPMVGTDVEEYVGRYHAYVASHASRVHGNITPIDPAPRVVLDPALGMLTIGRTAKEATIAADIYRHTMRVLERSENYLGGYRGLPTDDIFDVEYWELEQAKLRLERPADEFTGRVALVTGAASGIGRACAAELLARGAAVAGVDVSLDVVDAFAGPAWLGCRADVTDPSSMDSAIATCVDRFGGIDHVVVSAGIIGESRLVADLDSTEWDRVMAVNVDSVASLLPRVYPLLKRSPVSPSVVIVASKNVSAPGRSAAAYSASKAALTQLARVTALEWAIDGIRVNCVHPDAVFNTGLWSTEVLAARAASYDMSIDNYKRRNLLGIEIHADDVARAVVLLCGDAFKATTGAQIPIDGGSDRVI